jgi:hypothetical protein
MPHQERQQAGKKYQVLIGQLVETQITGLVFNKTLTQGQAPWMLQLLAVLVEII